MATSLDTSVPIARSQEAIRKMLRAEDCDQVMFGDDFGAGVMFIFFRLVLDDPDSGEVRLPVKIPVHLQSIVELLKAAHPQKYGGGKGLDLALEQAMKVAWRNVHDWLRASFTAVEVGIMTPAEAFLSSVVTENGYTVGERLLPNLPSMLHRGTSLPLLTSNTEVEVES